MDYTWEIAKIIFYLALVVGLIYLLNFFLKNNISRNSKGKHIKLIERIHLSPKSSLLLITVDDVVLLLSNTDNKVQVLERWDSNSFPDLSNNVSDGQSFKEYWQQIVNSNRRDRNE